MSSINTVRHPRSIVTVNGIRLTGLSWEVNNNGYYHADTFSVLLTLTQPDQPQINAAWWSQQTILDVVIYDGIPTDPQKYSIADLSVRIRGLVDTTELDPINKTVRVTGRDYTSRLIDTKTEPPNQNWKASDVAAAYAKKYGLKANIAPTKIRIGTYSQGDYVHTKVGRSAWDILCYLAQQEQYIVYVSNQTLNFIPFPDEKSATVLTLDASQRITTGPAPSLSFVRNLTIANGIVVYVRSWNSKNKKGFTVFARLKRTKDKVTKKRQPLTGEEQIYTYRVPNLTKDQAQQKANAYLASLSRHEVKFEAADMPGNPDLDPFQPVKWVYQGTQYEQVYYLELIIRSFSFDGGYKMTIRGKNHSVNSQVLL